MSLYEIFLNIYYKYTYLGILRITGGTKDRIIIIYYNITLVCEYYCVIYVRRNVRNASKKLDEINIL